MTNAQSEQMQNLAAMLGQPLTFELLNRTGILMKVFPDKAQANALVELEQSGQRDQKELNNLATLMRLGNETTKKIDLLYAIKNTTRLELDQLKEAGLFQGLNLEAD